MRLPSKNPITMSFGATTDPYTPSSPHMGTDFSYLPDNAIYAPFAGRVSQGYNDRDGNGSYMTDPQGRFHGLLHASKYLVPNGASVSEGEAIAIMGETGFAQGVHLHWAVKENGVFIDPMTLIKEEEVPEDYTMNKGDVINYFNEIIGHPPTQADLDAWIGQTHKKFLYEKVAKEGLVHPSDTTVAKQLIPGIYEVKQ